MSIFYSEVSKDVQDALQLRKSIYGATTRNDAAHAWLYRKTAFVEAEAFNPRTSKSNQLTVPKGGGIQGANSLYESNGNANFIPKPHINSVKISNDGDLGSLLKCEVSFTVYSLTDLNAYQPFLDLGASLTVKYGWTLGGNASGKEGKFSGVIYNFSYTVNESGGFNCITYAISVGANALAVNITAGIDSGGIKNDIVDNTYVSANLSDKLQELANIVGPGNPPVEGIGTTSLRYNLADEIYTERTKEKSVQEAYITLQRLVALINENLLKVFILGEELNSTTNFQIPQTIPSTNPLNTDGLPWYLRGGGQSTKINPGDFLIVCNGEYTKGLLPKNPKDLVSANPLQMIFPGYATYGTITFFAGATDVNAKFQKGDLSQILLNVRWLRQMFNEIGAETQDRQKSADQSISKFLLNIFNAISDNSGTRFKLSLTSDPKNPKRFVIVDVNYIDKQITPYILTAVNNQSICRAISLASQVPSAMSSVAFVSANSPLTTMSTRAGEVLNGQKTTIKKETIDDYRRKLSTCVQKFGHIDIKKDDISQLRTLLKDVYEFATGVSPNLGASDAKDAIPFPIDFSATLDGIEGFVFGNTVTTNYLPAVYQNNRVAFTIKKIDHTLQNNDWITTISTICRLLPEDVNKSTENNYVNEQTEINNAINNVSVSESDSINASLRDAGIYDERHNSDGTVTFSGFKG